MALSQAYFQNAHHFEVNDSQFINIANSNGTIINNTANSDFVSTALWQYAATGATFDSAERYPAGMCHPGTRQRITEQIINWIDDPETIQRILWLYGPAGSGKSAIAQTICEILANSRPERYGGSFFFARGPTYRGNALKLFTTLSYQLAIHFPAVRSEINKALNRDPALLTKSMEIQLMSLIVQPLLSCDNFPSHSPVMIIDGLDECADDEGENTQRNIIALIAKSIFDHNLPIRFMIASRPEYWIRDAFDSLPLPEMTLSLSLRDELDADKDIKAYLTDEFERIRVENKRAMGSVVLPWPSTKVVDRLVYEASGQFIYASTVLKFVGKSSRFSKPQEQLQIITSPGPHRASAFSELDRLYATILSAYPRWETMKRVLGGLLAYSNTTIIKVFLNVDPDELVLVLDALSSLIDVIDRGMTDERPERISTDELFLESISQVGSLLASRSTVLFCHLSFCDFLKDEQRSGAFHIDVDGFRDEITRALFDMFHRNLDQAYETEQHLFLKTDFTTYHWIMYIVASKSFWNSKIDTLFPLITHLTERLLLLDQFYTGRSMNSMVCFTKDLRGLECAIEAFFENIKILQNEHWRKEETKRVDEFRTACQRFQEVITLAQNRALHAMTMCIEFNVTPVLVYLTEYHMGTPWITSKTLSTIPGTTDGISIIKQHCHLIDLSYFYTKKEWSLKIVNFKALCTENASPRIQGEWRDQRAFIIYHLLKPIFDVSASEQIIQFSYRRMLQDCQNTFFRLKEHHGHMQNGRPKFVQMLASPGINMRSLRTDCSTILDINYSQTTQFCNLVDLLDEQTTDLRTRKLLQDHDKELPGKMTATVEYLFKQYFMKDFAESYNREIRVRASSGPPHTYRPITVSKALPLPQGFNPVELRLPYPEDWHSENPDWHTFHDELFETMDGRVEGSEGSEATPPVIDPLCWHPFLAARLLNALVKFLYGQVYPRFSISNSWNSELRLKFKKSLSYIPQCLPFALPTSDNLEALRFIVYLYPQVIHIRSVLLLLPEGLWLSIVGFLQKYSRDDLSFEELCLFEAWLYSQDHSDIRKYVHQ